MNVSLLALISAINDATALANALGPLVQRAMADGKTEVTEAEVDAAQAHLNLNIQSLKDLIVKAETP
jgi:hypothetical protein